MKKKQTLRLLLFCLLFFSLVQQVAAQVKTITGSVTDDKNNPVQGVSVTVKNTTTSTATDAKGAFSLALPAAAGWSIGSAIPMVPTPNNPNEFTWTGPLVAGEIKFPTAKSWTSDTFMAATAGQSISNNKALLALNGNPDLHWKLSNTEAGNYKITLNTKDQTVIFQK